MNLPSSKEVAIGLTMIATATSLALAAGELAIRIMYQDITTTADATSYFAQRWLAANPIRLNALGFREQEISERVAHDRAYVIAVVGDSFTYGQGIDEHERLTEQLQERLDDVGEFVVLNFGKSGTETVDHIAMIKQFVLPLQPDFILLQWFVNDVEDHDSLSRPAPMRLIPSDRISAWLHHNSALFFMLNRQWMEIQVRLGWTDGYVEHIDENYQDPNSIYRQKAYSSLNDLIDISRNSGVDVGIVAYPQLVDVGQRPTGYPLAYLFEDLRKLCSTKNATCVDLRSTFESETAQSLWANRLDSHPSGYANELATEAVVEAFGEEWLNRWKTQTEAGLQAKRSTE